MNHHSRPVRGRGQYPYRGWCQIEIRPARLRRVVLNGQTVDPAGLAGNRLPLAGHLRRDAAEILGITRACFDRYREIFTEPYPYDSCDQAFVPELEAGAVEDPGCVTFRDEFLFPRR